VSKRGLTGGFCAVAASSASVALVFVATTLAASPRPSDRGCLVAWNAPANHANRLRVLADRPIAGLSLLPGIAGTDTWSKGSAPKETTKPACLLTVAKPRAIRVVTGIWSTSTVSRWSFGRPIPPSKPFVANVRLLSDGRVTKIYRH
jgi:hypothetical protein